MTAANGIACALAIASIVSCSSSDSGVRRATFEAAPRVPGASQVYLDSQDESGETVTLAVRIRDLADVASADLFLVYDPVRLVFFSWSPGALMEQAPGPVTYDVGEQVPGSLRMQVSRTGPVDAGPNDPVLVVLRFKVVALGETPTTFTAPSSIDDPQGIPHPGVQLYAGVFSGF